MINCGTSRSVSARDDRKALTRALSAASSGASAAPGFAYSLPLLLIAAKPRP